MTTRVHTNNGRDTKIKKKTGRREKGRTRIEEERIERWRQQEMR